VQVLSSDLSRSPLQWALFKRRADITRLFIERGASGDYVSALRWTPLFYLLVDHSEKSVLDRTSSTIEFLGILSNDDVLLDLEVRDKDDMTILDHTVRYGTGDEVSALLQLGAQLAPQGKDPWNIVGSAMSQAIVTANFSTYLALFPYYQQQINSEYGDGWSMLHLAAYMGRDDMVRHLLENGAEEFYVDLEEEFERGNTRSGGNKDERGYQFFMTYETYTKYIQALHDFRKIEIVSEDTECGEVEEIFWDTNEE
jgi:ankyrin repeat protein